MDYLHIMSTQWETARHCHSALSVLSSNIRQAMDTPSTEPSPADNTSNRNNNRNDEAPTRSKRRRLSLSQPSNEESQQALSSSAAAAAGGGGAQAQAQAQQPMYSNTPDTQNTTSASATATTAYLYFPEAQQAPLPSQPSSPKLPGAGNFDLNMGDLLTGDAAAGLDAGGGTGLDSFLDLFGGQFPGF